MTTVLKLSRGRNLSRKPTKNPLLPNVFYENIEIIEDGLSNSLLILQLHTFIKVTVVGVTCQLELGDLSATQEICIHSPS
jgi:hypothetical protein